MNVHLYHLGKSFAAKKLIKKKSLTPVLTDPIVYQPKRGKFVVVCKCGVVGYWGMNKQDRQRWNKKLGPYLIDAFAEPAEEVIPVSRGAKKDGLKKGEVVLKKLDAKRAALVAFVLGQSLALDHYEAEVEKAFEDFGKVTKTFARKGRTGFSANSLLKKVAFAMHVQHMTVSRVELLDRPNLIWEDVVLGKLYDLCREEYELDDRYEILNEKLRVMFQNVEFILNVIDSHRTIILEVIIVLLILIEVVLFIYEIWW